MSLLANCLMGGLTVLAVVQTFLVARFAASCSRGRSKSQAAGDASSGKTQGAQPRAGSIVVLLCVRGGDPTLAKCLDGLGRQSLGGFQLRIIADHADDPGLALAREVLPESLKSRTEFIVLEPSQRLETCSLKCSALVAGCERLDESIEFVAMIDADTLPTTDWLERMVEPFGDDARLGACTALRWYSPTDSAWGSHVRYVWNAAAIVQMWWYSIAWGGSLMVRRRCIDEAGLTEVWSRTFCEDTPLTAALAGHGYRIKTLTDLVMDNRESIDLPSLVPWISRQLLTARLHHPQWPLVAMHALLTTVVPLAMLLVMIATGVMHGLRPMTNIVLQLLFYEVILVGLTRWISQAAVSGLRSNDPSRRIPGLVELLPVVLVSQVVYPWAALRAVWSGRAGWRQIDYRIERPSKITRLNYGVYRDAAGSTGDSSL